MPTAAVVPARAPAPVDARSRVAVHPASCLAAHRRLFGALEHAFPVRFVAAEGPGAPCEAIISVAGATPAGVPPNVAALVFADASRGAAGDVALTAHPAIDRRLHSIVLDVQELAPALTVAPSEDVLASAADGAVWTRQRGPQRIERIAAPLPALDDDEVLRDGLGWPRVGRRLAMIALVQHLRALAPDRFAPVPLRAAFVFDDPNLRRMRYGHIDYARLVEHADAHGYHAAMAMVPLDARAASRRAGGRAGALFRARPDRLSLAIHGNDHHGEELMRPRDDDAALALGAQALRRMRRLQARTGVPVAPVMIPPHGRCSPAMVRALGALGYDALCAIHAHPWTAEVQSDTPLAGWFGAGFIDGCAVIPRIPLTNPLTDLALRAFLDQPLVLYGHHDDVAAGLEPLAAAAERVGRLGDARWCSLADLARSNYRLIVDGRRATLQPWANRVVVELPAGVEELTVEDPSTHGQPAGLVAWSASGGSVRPFGAASVLGETRRVDVRLHSRWEADPGAVSDPPRRVLPRVRRQVTEARDRAAPLRRRLSGA